MQSQSMLLCWLERGAVSQPGVHGTFPACCSSEEEKGKVCWRAQVWAGEPSPQLLLVLTFLCVCFSSNPVPELIVSLGARGGLVLLPSIQANDTGVTYPGIDNKASYNIWLAWASCEISKKPPLSLMVKFHLALPFWKGWKWRMMQLWLIFQGLNTPTCSEESQKLV